MPFWRAADGSLREVEGSFARYVDSLAPYFDEIVLCVPLMSTGRGDGTPLRAANVSVAPLPHFDGPAQFYPRLAQMLPRLSRFVASIDVLHCRVPTPAAVFAMLCARALHRPAFLLVVGDLAALRPTMPYRGAKRLLWGAYTAFEEWNVQWMAGRALTFANGGALAAKHSRDGRPVIETRTTTIAASDISDRADTCAGGRVRLLAVSRIDPRKGLRVLPAVVRRLVDGGRDVSIDIVGPPVGGPGEAEARAIASDAQRLGIADRVRLTGPVPLASLLATYRDYDIFLLPTLPGEGIPRVLLEAMSGGVPVVTTDVAGIPSLVEDGRNGLLVREPAPEVFAAAVERIIADARLRRCLIANGYDTARGHTLEAQAAEMMGVLSSRLKLELRRPAPVPAA